jgi:hypothetical protein
MVKVNIELTRVVHTPAILPKYHEIIIIGTNELRDTMGFWKLT